MTFEDAVEEYKTLGDWQYADREAAWKWMYECGAQAERNALDELIAAMKPVLAISDRKHDAWDHAYEVITKLERSKSS